MNKPDPTLNNDEEQIEESGEVLQKAYEFVPQGLCSFRQRGTYLVCVSCEIQHAVYIGMDKIMVGEDEEGKPIIQLRSQGLRSK